MEKSNPLKLRLQKAFPHMLAEHFDSHATDLYVLYSKEVHQWLKDNYEFPGNIVISKSNPECTWAGAMLIDIPFAAGGCLPFP